MILDQVSISDPLDFDDTHEDWPLRQGYGALIERCAAGLPIQLNTLVSKIDWQNPDIKVETNNGVFSADKVLITVSTGVLGARDIQFSPSLPQWKLNAIDDLPLGNYNNLFFSLKDNALAEYTGGLAYQRGDACANIYIRPFNDDYVFTTIAGRFAWWMEKQGEQASKRWFEDILVDVFGASIRSNLGRFKASAWGFDPWVKGAYSSARPGSQQARKTLMQSIEERLLFAGEAASLETFNTAHGAWMSGQEALRTVFE